MAKSITFSASSEYLRFALRVLMGMDVVAVAVVESMPGWSQVGKKKRSLDQMPKKRQIKAPRVVGREENV